MTNSIRPLRVEDKLIVKAIIGNMKYCRICNRITSDVGDGEECIKCSYRTLKTITQALQDHDIVPWNRADEEAKFAE